MYIKALETKYKPSKFASLFFLRFYLFIHERHRQREKEAPGRESDTGLDPRSPGSHPGPKAALNL